MTIENKLKAALGYAGISQSTLAQMIGQSASNFNQKIKRGTLSNTELEKIAEALGGKYVFGFEFPDGTRI